MGRSNKNNDAMTSIAAIGVLVAAAGMIGWILGARGGRKQYRQLVKRMGELVDQAQDRAREAQSLILDKTEDLAHVIDETRGTAQQKLHRMAKMARK